MCIKLVNIKTWCGRLLPRALKLAQGVLHHVRVVLRGLAEASVVRLTVREDPPQLGQHDAHISTHILVLQ